MIANLIILGLNVPNWLLWTIGGIAVFLLAYKRSSLQIEDDKRIKESIRKDEEEEKKKELERGYYFLGNAVYSEKTFFSTLSEKIRITLCEKDTKDLLMISSSWPMEMSEDDLKNLQRLFPELISVKEINQSQLSLKKSPAAMFCSIKENLVQHLFSHLNKKYAWINQKMIVSFHYTKLDRLNCHLNTKTSDHVALGVMLGDIPGIANKQTTIAQMEEKNDYQFDLAKDDSVEWEELLPKIQKIFQTYFIGGVEFIGPNKIL